MDAVESTVTEDDDHVAGFRQRLKPLYDVIRCRLVIRRLSRRCNIRHDSLGVEPFALGNLLDARDARKEDAIGLSERLWQFVLKNSASGRV